MQNKVSDLEYALMYLKYGWTLLPMQFIQGEDGKMKKQPMVKWKEYQDRQPTEAEVTDWISKGWFLGIITGKTSGIVIVDDDRIKHQLPPLILDSTIIAKTKSGGTHYYFKYDRLVTNHANADVFVDIRGEGGYCVLPPFNGYQWIKPPRPENRQALPPLDPELEKQIVGDRISNAGKIELSDFENIWEGGRNQTMYQLACSVWNNDKLNDGNKILQLEWLNETRCRDKDGNANPLSPHELQVLISSAKSFVENHPKDRDNQEDMISSVAPRKLQDVVVTRMVEKELEKDCPKTGYYQLDKMIKGFVPSHLYTLTGDTNVGKCFGKGTKLLLANGEIKNIEDIIVGDLLIGPDNKPRKVLSLARGKDNLFQIKQQWGIPYVVNSKHILSLKCSTLGRKIKMYKEYKQGKIINIPLDEYLKKSNTFKKFTRGWHIGVEYKERQTALDPYVLGLWLGDGCTTKPVFWSIETEIIEYLSNYAKSIGLSTKIIQEKSLAKRIEITGERGKSRKIKPLFNILKEEGLIGNKHIPNNYRINSKEFRLKLLAGIIDTDGWIQKNKANNGKECYSYAISITNEKLADDILLLATSLGFNSTKHIKVAKIKRKDKSIYKTKCFTISINGDLTSIPVLVPRKKITSIRTKAVGFSSFKVIPLGLGDYYGFELSGDGLFLLSDCTVTHNTSLACNFAVNVAKQGKKVLYLALEPDCTVVDYIASVYHRLPFSALDVSKYDFSGINIDIMTHSDITSIQQLSKTLSELPRYDLVIVDHIGYFITDKSNTTQEQSNVVKVMAGITKTNHCAVMLIAHLNKPARGSKVFVPSMNDISGSASFKQDSTDVWMVYKDRDDNDPMGVKYLDTGALIVGKSKAGFTGSVNIQFAEKSAFVFERADVPIEMEKEGAVADIDGI